MMTEPYDRLARVFGGFTVTIGNLMGMHEGIKLAFRETGRDIEPDHKWWFADKVSPTIWFSESWLDVARSNKQSAMASYRRALAAGDITAAEPEWSFHGPWHVEDDRIKLVAANGTWIWLLTGQTQPSTRIDGEPELLCEARWPD